MREGKIRGASAAGSPRGGNEKAAAFAFAARARRFDPAGMEPDAPPSLLESIAALPGWMLVVSTLVALAFACWLFARAFRILAALVALAVLAIASIIAWEHVFG